MKKQNGITVVTLVVAVSILIIISSMLIYNARNGIRMRTLKLMQNDIEILEDKIAAYYIKYGALPVEIQYKGNIYFEPQPNDGLEYYVIDLAALEGITLNYGLDFEKIAVEDDTKEYDDIYIINQQSHHIYYPKGIQFEGIMYYTNTEDDEISIQEISKLTLLKTNEETVDENITLEDENGDSITIPKGFNIDKDSPIIVTEGIVVEDGYENQYVWIPVFEKSDERSWGADYSAVATSKTAEKTAFTAADYTAIQTALKTYTATYTNSSYSDVWYGDATNATYGYYDESELIYYTNGNMTESEYNTLYNNMLVSVYKNGGFYIGRYEMGIGVATSIETAKNLTRTSMSEYVATSTNANNEAPTIEGMATPVSKANAVGYAYITQSQAQMLAEKMGEEYGYKETISSLMFGVQWDAVCVFLEKYGTLNDGTQFNSTYLTNNTYGKLWGNHKNATFTMDRGYYTTAYATNSVTWSEKSEKTSTSESWLCTTGASDQNSVLNIYDFSGNLYEWNLEMSSVSNNPVTSRGSGFISDYYASSRFYGVTYYSGYNDSARPALYIK